MCYVVLCDTIWCGASAIKWTNLNTAQRYESIPAHNVIARHIMQIIPHAMKNIAACLVRICVSQYVFCICLFVSTYVCMYVYWTDSVGQGMSQ